MPCRSGVHTCTAATRGRRPDALPDDDRAAGGPGAIAANLGYVAAVAAATLTGDRAAFGDERARQARRLHERLGLAPSAV